jgi:hypothetical protein
MPSGLWRIGPVIGVNWNAGSKARFGSVGYQSANWLFEKGVISDDGLLLECRFINAGPFFFDYRRRHIPRRRQALSCARR